MSFTYSGTPIPGTTDEVRFLLQDVDENEPIFQDEEIQYFLDKWVSVSGSVFKAAASLAETAAAHFAREVAISSDQTSIAMEQLQQKYEDLAGRLRSQAGELETSGIGPSVGGSEPWQDAIYGWPPKTFQRKMSDNPEAGLQENVPIPSSWLAYETGGYYTNG